RTPDEYATGHIPGSLNLPLNNVEERAGELDREKPIIVYCKSGCGRSPKACRILQQQGFGRVKNMFGGITEWRRIGGEIEGNLQEEEAGQTKMPVWELGHGCED
ncbi:MAG: rhodanese-like domain-containing protein, partial [bacterium]|nr:rhodanese-like domain-containing protein [bacterium]